MAENKALDCTADLLLCDEETKSLCLDDVETSNHQSCQTNGEKGNARSDSEPLGEEWIGGMMERERGHLPKNDYLMRLRSGELDLSVRREALDWLFKACAHHKFGEICLYLAMNCFDRFMPLYSLPKDKNWAIQLITVSCLSLAAKMEEISVPPLVDLQQAGEPRFLFEAKTIQRMEILVLNYLNWTVNPCTPFTFIEYYLKKVNDARIPSGPLITRSRQIIMSTIKGIDLLEFKSSEIAAAVALYVSRDTPVTDTNDALLSCIEEKGRVLKCLEMIQDLISTSGTTTATTTTTTTTTTSAGYGSVVSSSSLVACSPNGVLEAACLSYKSDENSSKRRKLDQEIDIDGGGT